MEFRTILYRALVVTGTAATAGALVTSAQPGVSVPDDYRIEIVAEGLDGPEGMVVIGSGQVAVIEAIDAVPPGPQPRLTLVSRSGHARTLATHNGLDRWVDVAPGQGRGFFVSSLGPTPPQGGIYRIEPNGDVTRLPAPAAAYISLATDSQTGDMYSARQAGGLNAIVRISREGVVTAIRPDTRAQGLVVTPERVLLASIQRQLVGAVFQVTNEVIARDLVTGAETVVASGIGTLVGSLALAGSGNLYLSDFKDGQIRRLAPDGAGGYVVSTFATGLSDSSARFPAGPQQLSFNCVAFDAGGGLYVTDYGAGRLYRITGRF